jgi:hypothetical protein
MYGQIPDRTPAPAGSGSQPVANGQGGVFWDTRWGSCIYTSGDSEACGKWNPNAAGLEMTVANGQTRALEDNFAGEPTEQVIALDAARDIPAITTGRYYLVSWINPYGNLRESNTANNIACTAVDIERLTPTEAAPEPLRVTEVAGAPATCPWQQAPAPNVTPVTTTRTTTPVVHTVHEQNLARSLPEMRSTAARTLVKTALRKALGRTPHGLRSSCRVTSDTRSTCTVRWSRSGASYRGSVKLWYTRTASAGRWRYSVDVTKRFHGRTSKIRRSDQSGGSVRLVG